MICITIFCAGNLYFSNKKNKVTIYYCSRFCLRIYDQLRGQRETDRDWAGLSVSVFILLYLNHSWPTATHHRLNNPTVLNQLWIWEWTSLGGGLEFVLVCQPQLVKFRIQQSLQSFDVSGGDSWFVAGWPWLPQTAAGRGWRNFL